MTVRLLVTVLICAAWSPVYAQASGTSTTNKANLVALERIWGQAQVNRDARTVAAMLGEHFVDTEYDGVTNNRSAFLAEITDPDFKPTLMTIGNVTVEVYGNAAVITGDYHAKGTYGNKPYEHFGRFTDTWVYQDGKWICVASHSSRTR
ncbi:MAG: nuclear transport factor 2 family protein [Terriglobales bacterium]